MRCGSDCLRRDCCTELCALCRAAAAGRGQFILGRAAAAGVADAAAPGAMAVAGQCVAGQRARALVGGAADQRRRPRCRPRTDGARPAPPSMRSLPRPSGPTPRWSARRILEILGELTREAASADGQAPVLDAAAVLERADWTQPRMARRFSSLIRGVLAEAEILGLIGSGALSQLGAAIAEDRPDDALGILGEHLPARPEPCPAAGRPDGCRAGLPAARTG